MSNRVKYDIFLADSSLELVPKELCSHPAVRKSLKRLGKTECNIILDKSIHYDAMRRLPDAWKRGRPDIVHDILHALEAFSNRIKNIYIHTYDNKLIWVDPRVKFPKSQERFYRLMEQLLKEGKVPVKGRPLALVTNLTFEDLLRDDRAILLHENGERFSKVIHELRNYEQIIIGAFPHKDFRKELIQRKILKVSVGDSTLEAFQAICIFMTKLDFLDMRVGGYE